MAAPIPTVVPSIFALLRKQTTGITTEDVARELGFSQSAVKSAIKDLCRRGHVYVHQKVGRVNRYALVTSQIEPPPTAAAKRRAQVAFARWFRTPISGGMLIAALVLA